ncbi:Major royal jelly protein [Deinococcus saxicola]|uniref:L-dopachrome tautomerase-related protein n=1 Tax=Deinococcus saxicola TaxID=249406 RepID=UPI0039EEA62F
MTRLQAPIRRSEVYARSSVPLANGTFTLDGRLIVSHHPMYKTPQRVSIFTGPDTLEPFPSAAWNTPRAHSDDWLDAVQGLRTDTQGRVWLLDMGTRTGITPKFVIWDCATDALAQMIRLPSSVLNEYSEPNDFVIDERHGAVYIADEGAGNGGDGSRAALIVVDTNTGRARRRLEGRPGIRAENCPIMLGGSEVTREPEDGQRRGLRIGVDGIALDHAGEWLYYGPLTGPSIWRLRTRDLLDGSLDDDELQRRAECYADRPNTGGMWMDAEDNLYLTEVAGASVGCIGASNRSYQRVLTRDDLRWPDDVIPGPDGALYVVVSQLPAAPPLGGGQCQPSFPFIVLRFWPEVGAS